MTNKEDFIKWLPTQMSDESNGISSYVRALEIISENLKKDIFIESDPFLISNLYDDALKNQTKNIHPFNNSKAPSYGESRYYSAALGVYKKFLENRDEERLDVPNGNSVNELSVKFEVKKLRSVLLLSGLQFSDEIITRFTASLLTKPFVILTGLSGSGKTKLAQAFGAWICENEDQHRIVPVGADWTNREPLLGFPNALNPGKYVKPENGVLDLLITALKQPEKPFFLILDEMNLSHVERYFADFLSVMESGGTISLHSGEADWDGVPPKIELPKNLFIIGTVNIDETTYMFSPKVLDRAVVIEFRVDEKEMKNYLASVSGINLKDLNGRGANMAESFVTMSQDRSLKPENTEGIQQSLLGFFVELQKSGAEFGYRSASEILRFGAVVKALDSGWSGDQILDAAIMQKLLPKLHGSRRKLEPVLKTLAELCVKEPKHLDLAKKENRTKSESPAVFAKYPVSFKKICRMYDRAAADGFTSYAEA